MRENKTLDKMINWNDKEERKRYYRDYRKSNRDRINFLQKKWRDKQEGYQKKWRDKNKGYQRRWRSKNKEYANRYNRNWRKTNKERKRAENRISYIKMHATTPFVMEECALCGEPSTDCHHENLKIWWFIYFLCESCHKIIENKKLEVKTEDAVQI